MKTFEGDFYKFLNKIKSGEHFSLSRWGDGELMILNNEFIDIRSKGDGEFRFDPNIDGYDVLRKKMLLSYLNRDDEYYIGIACPCCVGEEKHLQMKLKSGQNEAHLTWANIFVNSNYQKTLNEFIPELRNHKVNIVVNKNSKFSELPFKPYCIWTVGTDAWVEDSKVILKIKDYIESNNIENEIFLFAAGPLANILTYELWRYVSKKNTYIDIGSVLDPYLQLKLTRGYQLGAPTINKICTW